MHDLRIRITESDGIRYAGKIEGDHASTLYVGENVPEALDAILDGLQSFRDIPAMVCALHFCPEFCQLAAAVHGLHLAESDETPTTEAIAILTKLRDSRQPEAIRTRAGNLLIDIAEDDRAVCDASSVDAADPIRDNIAGTRVRYIGEVELIKGKCGVLTGTKRTPEEICVECVEVKIDGLTWAIPCEFPQFAVCDASEVEG